VFLAILFALNSIICADVPLRNYSLTHSNLYCNERTDVLPAGCPPPAVGGGIKISIVFVEINVWRLKSIKNTFHFYLFYAVYAF